MQFSSRPQIIFSVKGPMDNAGYRRSNTFFNDDFSCHQYYMEASEADLHNINLLQRRSIARVRLSLYTDYSQDCRASKPLVASWSCPYCHRLPDRPCIRISRLSTVLSVSSAFPNPAMHPNHPLLHSLVRTQPLCRL